MTPVELNACARAYGRRQEAQRREKQSDIYNLAALIREMVWAKTAPSFERVFPENAGTAKEMSDDAMYATVRALNAAFGGTESG